ncbi:MAG: hypothetical protein KDM64_09070, partial [Verrucomicrobiae bacterium]|nr:hypothetical protein [Verrucomicrobiae bacterium]
MNSPEQVNRPDRTRFRFRLMAYLMVIVSSFTAGALYFAQRKLTSEVTRDQERVFEAEEAALNSVRRTRRAALSERCRNLVHKPRIRAALEDDALDLLYPSAKDELKGMMSDDTVRPGQPTSDLRARFYRFLDSNGSVITPAEATDAGSLSADEEAQLNLANLPQEQQLGYVAGAPSGTGTRLFEIIATPIASSETGEVIAALVIGFDPFGMADIAASPKESLSSGLWFEDRLSLPNFDDSDRDIISKRLSHTLSSTDLEANNFTVETKTGSYRLFHKRLNPDSMYAPAHEISLFSLSDFLDRQRKLRWQILGIGSTLLIAGYSVSRHLATRLSVPVEQLAEDSEKKRVSLEKAETALEQSQVELERSARFSADTSHQLKTPVAVLRAGLEELLARDDLPEEARSDISDFIRQTHRLGAIVEDLLLLSRMDGGRFHLDLA